MKKMKSDEGKGDPGEVDWQRKGEEKRRREEKGRREEEGINGICRNSGIAL
jgi:hypothetical protein